MSGGQTEPGGPLSTDFDLKHGYNTHVVSVHHLDFPLELHCLPFTEVESGTVVEYSTAISVNTSSLLIQAFISFSGEQTAIPI